MVEELSSYIPQDLVDLDALMHELSATSFCNEELLNNALNDANVHVYVIRDEGHIVATGTLCIKHTLEFTIADIESVVVSSKCRGRGYGKELMTAMIEAAKKMNVHQTIFFHVEQQEMLWKHLNFLNQKTHNNYYQLDKL